MRPMARRAQAFGLVLAVLALAGALFAQHSLGYQPCKLCLWERWPFYIGIPVLFGAVLAGPAGLPGRLLAGLSALIFVAGFGLGAYHALVEWGVFLGPSDCGGQPALGPLSVGDLQKSLSNIHVVACNAAPVRIAGLSFAGWNAVISALVAISAGFGAVARGR